MAREYIPMTDTARDALIGICFLYVINGVVVIFRLLGRVRGIGIGVDDVLAVAAFLLSGASIGFNASVFVSGVGYDLNPESELFPKLTNNLEFVLKITFIFTLFYLWSLICLKLSQLWFYYRIFALHLKLWIYIAGVIITIWGIVFTFLFTFLCDPVKQQWTLVRIGQCMDQILVLKANILSNVLTDIILVVLPIWTVWGLQMRRTEKFAVVGCFAIGLACVLIGIVRFWQILTIDLLGNLTGTSLTTFMLCSIELMLAGICINIPMLRPFYLHWRRKYKSSGNDSYHSYNPHSGLKASDAVLTIGSAPGPRFGTAAWIELDDDNDHDIEINGNRGSQVNLTGISAPKPSSAIQVSTHWEITRS
ncbi:hypothetical protein QBC42DRAFT_340937 [Cladorrhinum samala]|uniref:Rhodopsin domain-containing protein n=1 Tax=Cladorrhinum samala TaxID=585594 RepID=A0AAV9HEI2_9PEZI|nr:hypothetical protein QBC42DRAFT_340937 [Cladorrhinum samala]